LRHRHDDLSLQSRGHWSLSPWVSASAARYRCVKSCRAAAKNAEFLAPAGTPNRTLSWSKTNSAAKAISAYEKTGSSRRADLVKLVAGYVSPLGG
jgi:hypothetical protein